METTVCFLIASHLSTEKRKMSLTRAIVSCETQHCPPGVTAHVYASVSADPSINSFPLDFTSNAFARPNHRCSQFVHLSMLLTTLLLEKTTPDWIVFLDDDDWLEPDYLVKMLTLDGSQRHCAEVLHATDGTVTTDTYVGHVDNDHSGFMVSFELFCKGIQQILRRGDPTHGLADMRFRSIIRGNGTVIRHPEALVHTTVNTEDKDWKCLVNSQPISHDFVRNVDTTHPLLQT